MVARYVDRMAYDPDIIVTMDNRSAVIRDLIMRDFPRATLAVASNVDLANMYHTGSVSPSPTEIQRATSAAVAAAIAAMQVEIPKAPPPPPGTARQHYRTPLVLRTVSLGHAVMLVGPAGCGKTTIGEHVAEMLDLMFYITGTVNDTHELMGFVDGHGHYHATPFRAAFEHGGVWVADEIDAWDAPALLAANSALANGYATFPDVQTPVRRHTDFRMVATANTFGTGADRVYVGRNELDAASLDRFAVIDVDYDLDLERMFAGPNDRWLERVCGTSAKRSTNTRSDMSLAVERSAWDQRH